MNPYEYHNGKLGVKTSYLTSDKNSPESLSLIRNSGLNKRMNSNNFTEKQLRRACYGFPSLIEFDSLSQDWQNLIILKFGEAKQKIRKSFFAECYEYDTEAYQFFQQFTYGKEQRYLPEEVQEEYTANASVINTILKVRKNRVGLRKAQGGKVGDIWEVLSKEVNNFLEVPHTLHTNKDNLRKQVAKFVDESYPSIVSKRWGNDNARIVNDAILKLLTDMFAEHISKPTATEIARTYDSFINGYISLYDPETGELYNPKDFKKLSNTTVKAYLAKWENRIGTDAKRSGNRQILMGKYIPHHETEAPKLAGSLISIDDRQPPFWYEKGKRMWFYIGIDLASECMTTFVYGKSKEGIILDFYRQMVRNHSEWGVNMPHGLECESSLNSSFTETFLKEGRMFSSVRIEANNARGKRIERYFGALRYENEKSQAGWIARPFAKMESQQAGPETKKTIIPYDQLVEARLKDIEDWNNSPNKQDPSISRFEYFINRQDPTLRPTNWRGILPHLGHRTETSCNAGYVVLQGKKRMIALNDQILTGEELISRMKLIESKDVQVFWLDANDGSVLKALVYQGQEFICELMPIPRYQRAVNEQTDADLANRKLQIDYAWTVQEFMRQQKNAHQPIGIVDNRTKTISKTFKIEGIKRYEARETPVEVMDEELEEVSYNPSKQLNQGWSSAFNI